MASQAVAGADGPGASAGECASPSAAAVEASGGTLVGADEAEGAAMMFTTGRRADMTDRLTLANGRVSLVEVRAFRASIPARRFPGLRHRIPF